MQAALRGSVARPCPFKRPWCGATDARRLTTHDGTKIDLLAVAPKTVGFWVDQASLLWPVSSARWNTSKGTLFWEAIRPLLVAGKLEEWSLWHRNGVGQASFARHLFEGTALAAQGRERRQLPALHRRPRHNFPSLLRVPCFADRAGHARLTGAAAGGAVS